MLKEEVEEEEEMRKTCETRKVQKGVARMRGAFLAARSAARGRGEEKSR